MCKVSSDQRHQTVPVYSSLFAIESLCITTICTRAWLSHKHILITSYIPLIHKIITPMYILCFEAKYSSEYWIFMNMQSVKTNPEDLTVVFHKEHGGCHGPVCKIMHDAPGTMYQNNLVSYISIILLQFTILYRGFQHTRNWRFNNWGWRRARRARWKLLEARYPQIQSPKHTAGSHKVAAFILGITYTYTYNFMPIWCSVLIMFHSWSCVYKFLLTFTFTL